MKSVGNFDHQKLKEPPLRTDYPLPRLEWIKDSPTNHMENTYKYRMIFFLKKKNIEKSSWKERQKALKYPGNFDLQEPNKKLLLIECSLECNGRSKPFKPPWKRPNNPWVEKKIRSHENHKNIVFKIRRSGKIAEEIKKIKERKNPHQSEQLKKDHSWRQPRALALSRDLKMTFKHGKNKENSGMSGSRN